jgi:hypothetical protein
MTDLKETAGLAKRAKKRFANGVDLETEPDAAIPSKNGRT